MQSVFDAGIDVSRDGRVWTRAASVESSEAAGFALGEGGLVAGFTLENPTSFQGAILRTIDGETWTQALLDDGGIAMVERVSAEGSSYVALGRARSTDTPFTGAAWWSVDGATWQRAIVPDRFSASEWSGRDIVSIGGAFLAAVQVGEGQIGLLASADGRSWRFLEPMPAMTLNDISLLVIDDRVLLFGTENDDPADGVVWEGTISR